MPPVQDAEIAGQQHALGAQLFPDIETHVGHFERQIGQTLVQLVARGTFVAKSCRTHPSLKQWHNVHRALRPLRATVTQNSKRSVNVENSLPSQGQRKTAENPSCQTRAPRFILNSWFTRTIDSL
jgi:hypothetical protein